MNSVLIITGNTHTYGTGHAMRMRTVALELKKKKIPVQMLTAAPEANLQLPLTARVAILDRRDTAFNPGLPADAIKIAVDNRGPARDEADITCDLLPHHEMTKTQYGDALRSVVLHPSITALPSATPGAEITLHESRESAISAADFPKSTARLSPAAYRAALAACSRPALYFGQALFEALYLGKSVQLYPVSEYHKKLAVDLYSRKLLEPDLLSALDGGGLMRFVEIVAAAWRRSNA